MTEPRVLPLLAGAAAVSRARRFQIYPTGKCLNYVSNVLTNGRMLAYYGKSGATANESWEKARFKHGPDPRPPAGVPVYVMGSRYGHIMISTGNGYARSTDWPFKGQVGEVKITDLAERWNRRYIGWSEDLCGVRIPGFPLEPPRVLVPYPGHQHWEGGRDDSHVRQIQIRLKQLGHYKGAIDGKYGPGTKKGVLAFQKAERITRDGFVGRTTWGRLKIYNRAP